MKKKKLNEREEAIEINESLGKKWAKHCLYYGKLHSERNNIASQAFCKTFPDLKSYLCSNITTA